MTERERSILRRLIDEARRQQTQRDRICYCGRPVPEERGPNAKFCSVRHQKDNWRRTKEGRRSHAASKRRTRERRRVQATA